MDRRSALIKSLADQEYRHEFVAEHVAQGLAFQIRALRDSRGWTQVQLAEKAGKKQETISQLENPDYGRYSLSTLKKLAAAFDVALFVRFAPFSELVDWTVNLTPDRLAPPSYEEEKQQPLVTVVSNVDAAGAHISIGRTGLFPDAQYGGNAPWETSYVGVADVWLGAEAMELQPPQTQGNSRSRIRTQAPLVLAA